MRVDALELGTKGHLDHRELRQLALDAVEGGLVLDHLARARRLDDRVFKRSTSVLGRVELVEMLVAAAAEDVAEAHARRVDVEEDRGSVRRVPEVCTTFGGAAAKVSGPPLILVISGPSPKSTSP